MVARLGPVSQGVAGFSVRVEARNEGVRRLTDKITGHFRGGEFQWAMGQTNEDAAYEIQNAMLKKLNSEIKATGRAQRGTQYLVKAVASLEFRRVTVNGFVVGPSDYLENSKVRLYYRRIDDGDTRTMSGKILFSNGGGGKLYGPWTDGKGERTQPPGYKHAFMPMGLGRGVQVDDIGPWPAYRYSAAGIKVYRRMNMARRYKKALDMVGIPMTEVQ